MGNISFDHEEAFLRMDNHHFIAGVKIDGKPVFEVESSDLNADGSLQCPIWKVHLEDADKLPDRVTTLHVMESMINGSDDGAERQYMLTLVVFKVLDSYLTWTQTISGGKPGSKNRLLLAGYVSLDMAECVDFMENLADEAGIPKPEDIR